MSQIAQKKIKHEFEIRQAIMKKVLADNGGNIFTLYWRREKKDD
jgi:hypothetical protein